MLTLHRDSSKRSVQRGFIAARISLLLAIAPPVAAAAQTPDTLPPDPAHDAYLDETARHLVLGAKAARDTARLAIDAYTAIIRERMSFDMPTLRRNRPWVHGERAVRVRWSREEPDVAHVLGARLQDPMAGDPEYFSGLRAERFAADPLGDPFIFGFAVFIQSPGAQVTTRSPLGSGSESHYQFRSGDTISVGLSDGRTVRAVSVTVIPRYRNIRLVSAIMWIDPESFGIVRVAYRLAKKVDREMSFQIRGRGAGLRVDIGPLDPADSALANDGPATRPGLVSRLMSGVVNNTLPRFEMDITTVIAEYGLWELRHWLPRSVRWQGYMTVAEGVSATDVVPPSVPVTIDWALEIEDIRERGAEATAGTPASAAEAMRLWRQEGDSVRGEPESADPGETVTIIPADRDALTTSDLLPPSLWEDEGVDDATLGELASDLAAIGTGEGGDRGQAVSPWVYYPPGKTLRLLRYNPVERVSFGTRLRRDFGWGAAELTARVGTARLEVPDIDLTLRRDHPGSRVFVSFYRALRGGDLARRNGAPGPYLKGDPADFHWSHGAAIRILPSARDRNWLSLRLFAEQDADVVGDSTRNRVGAALAWRPWWGGGDSRSFGGGGSASVRGSMGDNPHVRALVEAALVVPLPDRMSLGIQAGAARVWGDPSRQDLWRIGETGDWLRGHEEAARSERIAMARVDLQRPVRFVRVAVFGDWASAGEENFHAVGAGLVFMDGMLRLDVAKGLRWGREGGPAPVLRFHLLGDSFF